jgi:hypothetical protein
MSPYEEALRKALAEEMSVRIERERRDRNASKRKRKQLRREGQRVGFKK